MNFRAPAPLHEQGHAVMVKTKKGRGVEFGEEEEGRAAEPGAERCPG